MLSSYRVLDLTDEKGFLCGKMLADLGANVIKIEKPGGDPSRNIGPFYQDSPDAEKSLYWWAYNLNKKGITLDIETADGQDIFKRLVAKADFVIESFRVGYMNKLGLSYSALSEINPKIVMTSITPFGQTGPYSSYEASDIIGLAMGGFMYVTGDPDRSPLRVSFDQAYNFSAAHAAAGTLAAHYYRQSTGKGQHVDVSIQQCVARIPYTGLCFWIMQKRNLQREGQRRRGASQNAIQRQTWPCKDGHMSFILLGGGAGKKTNVALVDWMDREGMADDFLKAFDWDNFDMSSTTQETYDRIEGPMGEFFLKHTMAELYEGAVERAIMVFPALSAAGITKNPQLKARGFWSQVEHPELCTSFTYPGAWLKLANASPSGEQQSRAPLIGEHNLEIYEGDLGIARDKLMTLKQAGVI